MNEVIIEQLAETFKQDFDIIQNDLGILEQAVKEKMRLLGQGLLQRLVNRQSNGYKGSSMVCECGNSMKFVQHRNKDIHTLFGWIKISRAYYHCSNCGKSVLPYDIASGLGSEQLSPGLAKACSLVAVDDSFEQTSRKLNELFGQKVSDTTIERVVQQVGSIALQQQDQELEDFSSSRQFPESEFTPQRLYVAADGTTVHEMDGWHECKIGTIYWEDDHKRRKSCYVGRFDNSEVFGWHLWGSACRCGLRQADEIIFLGDGELLDNLKEQHKKYRCTKREAMETLIRYISSNEEQMRYDVFRAKGYDIGSGAVEGACKHVVGKRLKQSGMIWSRTGSSATLALRIDLEQNRLVGNVSPANCPAKRQMGAIMENQAVSSIKNLPTNVKRTLTP